MADVVEESRLAFLKEVRALGEKRREIDIANRTKTIPNSERIRWQAVMLKILNNQLEVKITEVTQKFHNVTIDMFVTSEMKMGVFGRNRRDLAVEKN